MDYTLECETGQYVLDFNPKPKVQPSPYAIPLNWPAPDVIQTEETPSEDS